MLTLLQVTMGQKPQQYDGRSNSREDVEDTHIMHHDFDDFRR